MDLADLEALVGSRLPDGSYRIDPEDHARAIAAIHADGYDFESAHPVYGHLAPHCGMGWSLEELVDVVGTDMDSGMLFGRGDLTYLRPIQIDVPYVVRGHIADVERKVGSRTGTFDLVTLHLELIDESGDVVVVSKETYVFPRSAPA